jgi:hypothetical protein
MHCFELLGQRVYARTFDRQTTELKIRAAILNRFSEKGTPVCVAHIAGPLNARKNPNEHASRAPRRTRINGCRRVSRNRKIGPAAADEFRHIVDGQVVRQGNGSPSRSVDDIF